MPDSTDTAAAGGRFAILSIILISYVMIVLDISIVITGLPRIQSDLGFSDAGLSWVSSAYTLTFGGLLLLGARAGDMVGRRRMLLIGLAIFSLASLIIGLAQTPLWMITARAVQGLGSAILAPATLALLQVNFPAGPERTRAISYYAAAAGLAATVGLVLGGLLADWLSWRIGFFINLPIGVAMAWAARRFIVETERVSGRFDILGAFGSTLGMTALVYGIVRSADAGWTDALTVSAIALGLGLLGFFILVEWRVALPMMPLRLFASRERAAAYAARFLFIGANTGFYFFTTQLLQGVRGYSPAITGLAFLPATAANFVVAMAVPMLIRRFGNARVLAGSVAFGLIGLAWLSTAGTGSSYLVDIALPMVLVGIGQGGGLGPLTASGIARVAPSDAGAASGLVSVAHQLGSSLGLGILIAASVIGSGRLEGTGLLAHRVDYAIGAGAAMMLLALLLIAAFIVPGSARTTEPTSRQ